MTGLEEESLASSEATRKTMQGNRSGGIKPEMRLAPPRKRGVLANESFCVRLDDIV